MIPIYTEPKVVEKFIEAVKNQDTEAIEDIVRRIERTANVNLCQREINHVIENQLAQDLALRELTQNGMDAGLETEGITEINFNYEALDGEIQDETEDFVRAYGTNFEYRPKKKEKRKYALSVSDTGKGMTVDEMITTLLVAGNSSKKELKDNIGKHGQGFFSLLRQTDQVEIESHGWKTAIKKEDNQYYVEFVKIGGETPGTKIKVGEFNFSGNLDEHIKQFSRYVDDDEAVIKVNGKKINSRDEFGYELVETIFDKETRQEYHIRVYLGTGNEGWGNKIILTQKGLHIKRDYAEKSPKILVDIPTDVTLTRGRNVCPEAIEKYIVKNKNRYTALYFKYLLDTGRDRLKKGDFPWNPAEYVWLMTHGPSTFLQNLIKFSVAASVAGFGIASLMKDKLPSGNGKPVSDISEKMQGMPNLTAYTESTHGLSDFIYGSAGNILQYAADILPYVALGINVLLTPKIIEGAYTGYKVLANTIKAWLDKRKFKSKETKREFSWRNLIEAVRTEFYGLLPSYTLEKAKVIPVTVKKEESLEEKLMSMKQLKNAKKKGKLHVGGEYTANGIYLKKNQQTLYDLIKIRKKGEIARSLGIGILDILSTAITGPFRASAFLLEMALPNPTIPAYVTKGLAELGIGKSNYALQKAASYISSLVAKANDLQDIGVINGYYKKKGCVAWTAKPDKAVAAAYVVLNLRNDAVKKIKLIGEEGFDDKQINALISLVAHEYAHHIPKPKEDDINHTPMFYSIMDNTISNFYKYVVEQGIDIKAELNNMVRKT